MTAADKKPVGKRPCWDDWDNRRKARAKAKGKLERALILARPNDDEDYLSQSEAYLMACAIRYRMVQKHGSLSAKITDDELRVVVYEADRLLLQISLAATTAQQELVIKARRNDAENIAHMRAILRGQR